MRVSSADKNVAQWKPTYTTTEKIECTFACSQESISKEDRN